MRRVHFCNARVKPGVDGATPVRAIRNLYIESIRYPQARMQKSDLKKVTVSANDGGFRHFVQAGLMTIPRTNLGPSACRYLTLRRGPPVPSRANP